MEREEAKCITQAEEERMRQEAKCMEEELKPTLEDQQQFVTRGLQAVPETQVTQEVTATQKSPVIPEVEKTEPKKADSSVGQVLKSPRRTGPTILFGCP